MELGHKTITELTEELAQIPFFEDLEPLQLLKRVPFLASLPDDRLEIFRARGFEDPQMPPPLGGAPPPFFRRGPQ